ncbi:MAG TPA: polyprenyl synthetase family protein [Polyangiaceae bacterium]|nr:polyprenyl synthetase family protein [Polyangiaceae bacterium]
MVGEARHPGQFDRFVADVQAQVEGRLARWLDARAAAARALGPEVAFVADAVRQLVLRGGKRMRAVLLSASYVACGGEDAGQVVAAGAALELLQGYLLIHDDWMDGDEQRRGGPSVPAVMRARFGAGGAQHDAADAASILAGDLGASWALMSMLELELPAPRVLAAARELARVEEQVVQGQVVDVCEGAADGVAGARDGVDVEIAYALKTASYTVRGPVVMGALLAGADEARLAPLVAFAEPLGVAFQLRDDLLGAFGDPRATGKPTGSDLRKGKRTVLVREASHDAAASRSIARVFGRRDAGDAEVAAAVASLEACGARERVEARIARLALESREALARARLTPLGGELLAQAVAALTERDR